MRPASHEAIKRLGKNRKRKITSKFPTCPYSHTASWKQRKTFIENVLSQNKDAVMADVCDHTGYKQYVIRCKACKQRQGTVWARDRGLKDWCSFRYEQILTKKGWTGCFGHNISPVTGKLTLECCCGADTREFILSRSHKNKEAENKVGRDYGKKDSKFIVEEV